MKKNNYVIVYDDACPLCAAYTSGFVKAGFLNAENRIPFSNKNTLLLEKIDIAKAVNEIPLIETETNKVYYGIDALLEILDQKIPFIKKIGNTVPVKWLLLKLYKFISYNRKVIVASQPPASGFDCSPDFNIRYRLCFLGFFLMFNSLMLVPMQQWVLQHSMFAGSSLLQLQIAHFIFVVINIIVASTLGKKQMLEYLGQVNMLALLVILLNIPLITLNKYHLMNSAGLNDFFLGMITLVIAKEYVRRMKYAGIIGKHKVITRVNIVCLICFLIYLVL